MDLLKGTAPDGTTVEIPDDQEGDCEARSTEGSFGGGFFCCLFTEGHGPWHIAHTGAAICAVWPA